MSTTAFTLFCKTPWLGPVNSGRKKKAQREETTNLLLQFFTMCLAKPARLSVPFHPHLSAGSSHHCPSPHRTTSHKKVDYKGKAVYQH